MEELGADDPELHTRVCVARYLVQLLDYVQQMLVYSLDFIMASYRRSGFSQDPVHPHTSNSARVDPIILPAFHKS